MWCLCLQVELRKKEQQLERQSERLSASQRVIAEQEEELAEVARELEATEQENSRLRESMEKMMEGNDFGRYDEIADILTVCYYVLQISNSIWTISSWLD